MQRLVLAKIIDMGTSSRIIKKQPNQDSYKTLYCNYDGYFEMNNRYSVPHILYHYYQDEKKLDKLFELGDLSKLGKEPISTPQGWDHKTSNTYPEDYCLAYRDRQENCPADNYFNKSFLQVLKDVDGWYNYVWIDGDWYAFIRAGILDDDDNEGWAIFALENGDECIGELIDDGTDAGKWVKYTK